MNKTLPAIKYLLRNSTWILLIGFINVLCNAAVTDLIFYYTAKQNNPGLDIAATPRTMTFEYTVAIYILIICMIFFTPNFKTLLANGVSRRTFFLANVPFIATLAAVFAIWDFLVLLAHQPFARVILFSELAYPNSGLASTLVLPFFIHFLMGILGWLITLAYYRGSHLARWIISLAPFALLGILLVLNANSDGSLFDGLSEGYRTIMGTALTPHNPWIASISLFSLTALMCGVIYLLLRRAPLKD
jgi:hypothetical protein